MARRYNLALLKPPPEKRKKKQRGKTLPIIENCEQCGASIQKQVRTVGSGVCAAGRDGIVVKWVNRLPYYFCSERCRDNQGEERCNLMLV